MPGSNYNFTQDGIVYSFDEVFVRKFDFFENEYYDKLWVWGNNSNSKLGLNDVITRSTPVLTANNSPGWKEISSGSTHTAAIKTDGTLWTWGGNTSGQLGTGDTNNRSTPVIISSGSNDWLKVSSGYDHTAAIKTDGTLWTWGGNTSGQLGTNDLTNRSIPVTTFSGGLNWESIDCSSTTTMAIKADGTLWGWGDNFYLASKNTNTLSKIFHSQKVEYSYKLYSGNPKGMGSWADAPTINPEDFYTIDISERFDFENQMSISAIKTDGTLWTWGNGESKLGNNDINYKSTPVTTFAGGTNWKQVSSNLFVRAAIKTDGTLWTWGLGSSLGVGDSSSKRTPITTFAGGTNWKQVSCGVRHIAAVKTDGTLWVWGVNAAGQLGVLDQDDRSTPSITFAGGNDWKQVSCGYENTAAIKTDGTLWVWGNSARNGTNDPYIDIFDRNLYTKYTPVTTFVGGTDWKQVSCGHDHTAAIKTDGTLWTWGLTYRALLGTFTNSRSPVTTFVGGTNWKQVSCGYEHTAAIKTDGTLWTWGTNYSNTYALSDKPTESGLDLIRSNAIKNRYIPSILFSDPSLIKWRDATNPEDLYTISTSAAIKTDGTLWTWGSGPRVLGVPLLSGGDVYFETYTPITTFVGGTNWKQISESSGNPRYTTYGNSTAIKTDGTLWRWGNPSATPVILFAGTDWKQIGYNAAIKTDGTLWMWGLNNFGELGTGDLIDRSTPVTTMVGGNDWKQVSSGLSASIFFTGRSTAAIKTDGTLWIIRNRTPVTVFNGGTNWKQVSSGGNHIAAVKTDGTLWVWGDGSNGSLGNTAITSYTISPITTFVGGTNWKQVSCGIRHTAAIKTDGTLWTWGNNAYGQLGTNDNTPNRSTPVTTFTGGANWQQVFCKGNSTRALKSDGELYHFGQVHSISVVPSEVNDVGVAGNWDQVKCSLSTRDFLGLKEGFLYSYGESVNDFLFSKYPDYVSTPITTFIGGNNWKQVSCGDDHAAAVKTDGTLWVWGDGSNGQLGNFRSFYTNTPITTFIGGTNWNQVSSGYKYSSAIKIDGTLWVWGNNILGQLGINNLINRSTPITTFVGGTNWKQVSCGYEHTAATKTDGTLWIWGNNSSGQLGISDPNNRSIPVIIRESNSWSKVSCGSSNTFAIEYGQEPGSYSP